MIDRLTERLKRIQWNFTIIIATIELMNAPYLFIEDMHEVLERLGGNEALLERLLVKFHDTYGNSTQNLHLLLESSDLEEAYRLVHSIKGVSANLGIGKVYRSAIVLENCMKAEKYSNMRTETDTFLAELETVFAALS